jgi:hypothetical protein
MSQSQGPTGGSRYPRTSGGLVGAMLITVVAVVGFVAFRALFSDNEPTPIRTVDYQAIVKVGRADQQLLVLAPESLPAGWKATSATYDDGLSPAWHLGILTDKRRYVGVEESRSSIRDLVDEHVDRDAEQGEDVTIAGETWQSWTDAGGDYAVARTVRSQGRAAESVLVVGTAPEAAIRDFAGTLKGGPDVPSAG